MGLTPPSPSKAPYRRTSVWDDMVVNSIPLRRVGSVDDRPVDFHDSMFFSLLETYTHPELQKKETPLENGCLEDDISEDGMPTS